MIKNKFQYENYKNINKNNIYHIYIKILLC